MMIIIVIFVVVIFIILVEITQIKMNPPQSM